MYVYIIYMYMSELFILLENLGISGILEPNKI